MIAWPVVQARLVALLPTLPGWSGVTVFDSAPAEQPIPTEYVTVGWSETRNGGGTFDRPPSTVDTLTDETGTVLCELVVWHGGTDLPGRSSRAFDLFAAFDAAVDADRRLGVLPQGSTASVAADVAPLQSESGAHQRLIVTVSYIARV